MPTTRTRVCYNPPLKCIMCGIEEGFHTQKRNITEVFYFSMNVHIIAIAKCVQVPGCVLFALFSTRVATRGQIERVELRPE